MALKSFIAKMQAAGSPLKESCNCSVRRGTKLPLPKAFVIDEETRSTIWESDPNAFGTSDNAPIHDWLSKGDINRYEVYHRFKGVIATHSGIDIKKYPSVRKHLNQFKKELSAHQEGKRKWWESCTKGDVNLNLNMDGILCRAQSKDFGFTVDKLGTMADSNCLSIKINYQKKPRFYASYPLLALLNSKTIAKYLAAVCPQAKDGLYTINAEILETIPIPKASLKEQEDLWNLGRLISHQTKLRQLEVESCFRFMKLDWSKSSDRHPLLKLWEMDDQSFLERYPKKWLGNFHYKKKLIGKHLNSIKVAEALVDSKVAALYGLAKPKKTSKLAVSWLKALNKHGHGINLNVL